MRKINKIIIHCSATPPSMDIGVKTIRQWHMKEHGWPDVGYHGVIRRNGVLESGMPVDKPGYHTKGHNSNSVGICLVGGICGGKTCEHEHEKWDSGQRGKPENNFTPAQWATLERTVRDLVNRFPGVKVYGHNDFAKKACPCFDAKAWWASL